MSIGWVNFYLLLEEKGKSESNGNESIGKAFCYSILKNCQWNNEIESYLSYKSKFWSTKKIGKNPCILHTLNHIFLICI